MRRAILLLALIAPALARAQATVTTPGSITFNPLAVGASTCTDAGANLSLTATPIFVSGVSPANGGVYRVLASNTTPSTSTSTTGTTSSLSLCQTTNSTTGVNIITNQVLIPGSTTGTGDVVAQSGATQIIQVNAGDVVRAAGFTCDTTDHTIYVCVEFLPTGTATVQGSATSTIMYSVTPPAAPTLNSVMTADGALQVSWSPGSGGASPAYYVIVATDPSGAQRFSGHIIAPTTSARISGLTNGVTYKVTVFAYSASDTPSVNASNEIDGTPAVTLGFWDVYKAEGGKDQGGCASGPAGLGALLLTAAGLARLRRRS
jgi:hypothetical protein